MRQIYIKLYGYRYTVHRYTVSSWAYLNKLCGCYPSREAVFRCTTSSHSAADAVFSSTVLFVVALNIELVKFFDLASHRFQFGFSRAAFPFYSSYLQLFGSFFIHSKYSAVLFSSVRNSFFSKKIIFLFEK